MTAIPDKSAQSITKRGPHPPRQFWPQANTNVQVHFAQGENKHWGFLFTAGEKPLGAFWCDIFDSFKLKFFMVHGFPFEGTKVKRSTVFRSMDEKRARKVLVVSTIRMATYQSIYIRSKDKQTKQVTS